MVLLEFMVMCKSFAFLITFYQFVLPVVRRGDMKLPAQVIMDSLASFYNPIQVFNAVPV